MLIDRAVLRPIAISQSCYKLDYSGVAWDYIPVAMKQTSKPVHLTKSARRRLGAAAKKQGLSLEAYLSRLARQAFGCTVAQLLSEVFFDAESTLPPSALRPRVSVST